MFSVHLDRGEVTTRRHDPPASPASPAQPADKPTPGQRQAADNAQRAPAGNPGRKEEPARPRQATPRAKFATLSSAREEFVSREIATAGPHAYGLTYKHGC